VNESEYIERVCIALQKVPRKQLLIIDLANRYLKDGVLDFTGLAEAQPEVNMATAEAKMYGAHTMVAVDTLKRVQAIAEDA